MKLRTKGLLASLAVVSTFAIGAGAAFADTSAGSSSAVHTMSGPSVRGAHVFLVSGLLSTLKLSAADLQADLQKGESIAAIAATQGISETTLIADLTQSAQTQINQEVSSGQMTSAQATKLTANLATRLQKFVERKGLPSHRFGKGPVRIPALNTVASALNMDKNTLLQDLRNGQSLAEIAATQGISETTLIADLTQSAQTQINQEVSKGRLTSTQASQITAKITQQLKGMVERKGIPFNNGNKFGQMKMVVHSQPQA